MADDFNAAANLADGDDTDKHGLVMGAHFIEKASHPRLALPRLPASLMTFVSSSTHSKSVSLPTLGIAAITSAKDRLRDFNRAWARISRCSASALTPRRPARALSALMSFSSTFLTMRLAMAPPQGRSMIAMTSIEGYSAKRS